MVLIYEKLETWVEEWFKSRFFKNHLNNNEGATSKWLQPPLQTYVDYAIVSILYT